MRTTKVRRKLAVILHADAVDSTALVRANESRAHDGIRNAFVHFSETIRTYGGIVHEIRGDALLAEFSRASDAVSAALAFQGKSVEKEVARSDEFRPELRIGLSLGEVVVADNTLTGPDVVLAQRLEQVAPSGAVCVSEAVKRAVPGRFPIEYQDLGEIQFKGFEEPIRAFLAVLQPGQSVPAPEAQPLEPTRIAPWRSRRFAASASVLLIAVIVAFAWWQPWRAQTNLALGGLPPAAFPVEPSIAVLPFTNMSEDPRKEYLADGMSDSLITDLSKISGLFVIARNSSFQYKMNPTDVRQIGRDLGVEHVLEGSVQHVGNSVRVNVQLIDTMSGGHLWAERYDGTLDDVFVLQDEIVKKVVSALSATLADQLAKTVPQSSTRNLEAYDAFLRAMQHYRKATPDHYAKAIEYLKAAVEMDPGFHEAHAVLSSIYLKSYRLRFTRVLGLESYEAWRKTKDHIELALESPSATAYRVASLLSLERRRHDEAIDEANLAIANQPSDAENHATLALALILTGKARNAMESIDAARRLDPHGEFYYVFLQGLAEFGLDRFEAAVVSFERALELNPELWAFTPGGWGCGPSAPLLAAYGHLGRMESAGELRDAGAFECPVESIVEMSWPYKESRDIERLSEGLQIAGVRRRQ